MKKFVVLLVVVAITCFSAVAFAADVTVGGSYEVRSRDFTNITTLDKNLGAGANDAKDTQNRIRLDVNAKAGDVKGKLELESDFGGGGQDWGTGNDAKTVLGLGGGYTTDGGSLGFREAWVNFNIPGLPFGINVTAGHQLLTLGNGWFFRSMHFGSDAWVVANQTGPNTAAFVNVNVSEGNIEFADDADAYVLLDVFKLNEDMTVGADITNVKTRQGATSNINLLNFGVNFNGKLGPVALKAEADFQAGKNEGVGAVADEDYKGNQIVAQASWGIIEPLTLNATFARGTGDKGGNNIDAYTNFLDVDPHYTFLYEYKIPTAAGGVHTGFTNTTAFGVGATWTATKSLTLGADGWLLMATEDTNVTQTGGAAGAASDKVGTEVDLKLNWKMYDNLSWNWVAGIFMPGDAYKDATGQGDDAATGIQGILSFKF